MRAFRLRIAVSFLSGCLGVLSLGAGSAALPSVPSAQTKGQAALPNVLETRLRSPCVTPRHESIEQGRRVLRESKGRRVHLLLRLDRVADTSLKRQLGRAGIHLVAYRSPNTWFASFPTDLPIGHPVLARVRWVGRVPPADKLAPALREDTVGDWARTPDDQLHLVVRYFADADAEHLGRQLKTLGATILGQVPALHRMTLSLPKAHVSKLARQDAIRWIEPVPPPAAAECDRARSHIVADPVYPTLQGAGVAVGVFEGYHVCADHPGFGARAAQGDTDILRLDEESSHPTKMAGLIGGDGSQSISFGAATSRQWRGVAPQVDIFSYAFPYGAPDASSNYLDDLQEAIQNDGLDVASNAWGSTGGCRSVPYGEYLGMDADLDAIVLGALGRPISIVFSAGNERDGYYMTYTVQLTHGTYTLSDTFVDCISDAAPPFSNYGTLNHPKAAKNTIVVGAIDSYDNKMSDYSSWGPTADGRIKPDLVASGHHNGTDDQGISILDNLWGTSPGAPDQQGYRAPCDDFDPGDWGYGWVAGTSSAAALVSGALAIMLESYHSENPGAGDPLPSTLKAILLHSATPNDFATEPWFNPGPDYASGYGLLNVGKARNLIETAAIREGEIQHGETRTYFMPVSPETASVKITLVWDDVPGNPNVTPVLVNDLDLVVHDPDGVRHYPWTLDPDNPSAVAVRTKEDHLNNVEQVQVDNVTSFGPWEITVRGGNIPVGPQAFSLVADEPLIPAGVLSRQVCQQNMQSIVLAMQMRAADLGQPLDPNQWVDQLLATGYLHPDSLKCPSDDSGARCSYGMHAPASGQPNVIFYETANPGDNPVGDAADVASPGRHLEGNNYAFADGSVAWSVEVPAF